MNIIICNEHTYKYFEDYIMSIIYLLKAKLILFNYHIDLDFSSDNNYIFVQNVNNNFFNKNINNKNLFLINTEQLSVEKSRIEINKCPSNLIMIDFSISNLKYYNEDYMKFVLPYQINYNEIFNMPKQRDICLIGTAGNIPFNRQNILDLLKEKKVNVDIVSGFNSVRDNELFKYKIILNIGYYQSDCKIIESFRCDRCIYNKMIVISDLKEEIENYYLNKHMIFVDYNNIVNKVINVLTNYEEYYNNLFSNFNLKDIEEEIFKITKPLIDTIN
jgi:hypothetical protein